jgi:hypothetical protein
MCLAQLDLETGTLVQEWKEEQHGVSQTIRGVANCKKFAQRSGYDVCMCVGRKGEEQQGVGEWGHFLLILWTGLLRS